MGGNFTDKTFKINKKLPNSLLHEQNRIVLYKQMFGDNEKTPLLDDETFYSELLSKIPTLTSLLVDIYPKLKKINDLETKSKLKKILNRSINTFKERKDIYGRLSADLSRVEKYSSSDNKDDQMQLYYLLSWTEEYLQLVIRIHNSLKNEEDLDISDMRWLGTHYIKVYSKKLNAEISGCIMNKERFKHKGFSFLLEVLNSAEYNLGLIQRLLETI